MPVRTDRHPSTARPATTGPGCRLPDTVSGVRSDLSAPLPVTGVRLSLWRAAAVFRAAALVVCLWLIARWLPIYARPAVAVAVGVAMIAITAAICFLAVRGRAHRLDVVLADAVATAGLTIASLAAQTPAQHGGAMPTLTTIWAAGPALEMALLAGPLGGIAAAAFQIAASMIARGGYDGRTEYSGVLLLVSGALIGYVARLTVRAEDDLRRASAERAAVAERERLARPIHDGVLQVLGLVHRLGESAGGEWAPLAAAAAEQESALRALLTSGVPVAAGRADLADALRALRSERVTVSTPADGVDMPAAAAGELVAAVQAALHNVDLHAGADARAWVLVERLDSTVLVTVRDDGVGFDERRLEDASRAGRLGVAGSIRGRVADLGGQVRVTSAPGEGTEIEIEVPAR